MEFPRASGILLHPTSLPGRYGIGDLGEWAYRFGDYLKATGQSYWQVLPLGPTSFGDSPYQALSALAGNPLLISLDKLVGSGWLNSEDLASVPDFPPHSVDYGSVITYHDRMLSVAYDRFAANPNDPQRPWFDAWHKDNAFWLEDFALFMALKDHTGGRPWVEWPEAQALRHTDALAEARKAHARRIDEQRFRQWQFYAQWMDLKKYVNHMGIKLVGDIPIFVAHDSSDVWANPHLFYLDDKGNPTVVAGVPPDYFSETGQRWGNPLYRWDVLAKDGHDWWIKRFRATLALVDIVRIDHFRGFEAYWEVPASEPTAVIGQWVPGPNKAFFDVVKDKLGDLPIIAEDLGVITPGVEALRDGFGLPGMKILQFAFGDDVYGDNPFLPHNYNPNCIVYSGTHDNNTTLGWWQSGEATPTAREHLRRYIGHKITHPHWELIRLGMMSCAHTFIAPMQDVLGFGADTRMNLPGVGAGNWTWRFTTEWLKDASQERLATMTKRYGRWPQADREDLKAKASEGKSAAE
jgi:4-alpha-glucanotransferase